MFIQYWFRHKTLSQTFPSYRGQCWNNAEIMIWSNQSNGMNMFWPCMSWWIIQVLYLNTINLCSNKIFPLLLENLFQLVKPSQIVWFILLNPALVPERLKKKKKLYTLNKCYGIYLTFHWPLGSVAAFCSPRCWTIFPTGGALAPCPDVQATRTLGIWNLRLTFIMLGEINQVVHIVYIMIKALQSMLFHYTSGSKNSL